MNSTDVIKFKRGQVWWYNPPKAYSSPVQQGILTDNHPVLIFSTVSNANSTCTVNVLPITSAKSAQERGQLTDFYLISMHLPDHPSFVACNQIKTISTRFLNSYIGEITEAKMQEIEAEFARFIGFKSLCLIESTPAQETTINDSIEAITTISDVTPEISEISTDVSKELSLIDIPSIDGSVKSEPRKKYSHKVRCIETSMVYKSAKHAAKEIGVDISTIYKSIKRNYSVGGKYHFIFVD